MVLSIRAKFYHFLIALTFPLLFPLQVAEERITPLVRSLTIVGVTPADVLGSSRSVRTVAGATDGGGGCLLLK